MKRPHEYTQKSTDPRQTSFSFDTPPQVESRKGTNPKDLLGAKKVSLSLVPPIAIAHEACAMMDGARKYGPFNWRGNAVVARIYADAAKRHIDLWLEGQETADDSGVHHLGHARACLGILLDAKVTGNLIDDRPIHDGSTDAYAAEMNRLCDWVKSRMEQN